MNIITSNCNFKESTPPPHWLHGLLRPFDFLSVLTERRRIRLTCVDVMREYRRLAKPAPAHLDSAREVYARIVVAVCGIQDLGAAFDIVRLAEESFAMWPVDRPPRLRDIAQYLAMTDRLRIDLAASEVSSRAVDSSRVIAAEMIPEHL